MHRKVNILMVIWSGNLAGNLVDLAERFINDSHVNIEVVFCSDIDGVHARKVSDMGMKTHGLYMTKKYGLIDSLIGAIRLRNLIKRRSFNIIHFQDAMLPFVFMAGKFSDAKTKLVVHNHGEFVPFYEDVFKRALSYFKRIVYRILVGNFADLIIGVSGFICADLMNMGIPREKIRLLYNSTDIDKLRNIAAARESNRKRILEELSLNEGVFLVGTAARLVGLKRIDLLIKSFSNLGMQNSALLIMGEGPKSEELRILSSRSSARDKIIFLGFRNDAKDILSIMDAVVLPSKGEAFGLTVLESIIMKVPVFVMSDGGGVTELVENGKNGFICKDYDDLRDKLNEFVHKRISLSSEWDYDGLIMRSHSEECVKRLKNFYLEDVLKK